MTIELLAERRAANPILVLVTASIGCALTVLDSNVVAIVLPTVARELRASFADVEWVISTYVLCFASLLLPAGAIADRFGRRRVFLIGIAAFALTSLSCGLAPSAATLYLARALQGASAAFMLAPALAIIAHSFHGEAERNRAWAIWGGIMGLTMVLAPIVGGVIASALGWRWAFHINVPICALLALAAVLLITESRDADARRLDPAGIVFFAGSMFGLTWGLIHGQASGWSSAGALGGFAAGALALGAFVAAERLQPRPMLDLQLFRDRRFVGAVWAMFAYAACAQVMTSILPLFLQNGLGRSALEAGFAMLPFAAAMLAFPHVGRQLGRHLSPPSILMLGLIVTGMGNLLTGLGAFLGTPSIVMFGMLVLGSGGGLLNGETQKAIMTVVPHARAGMASGISTTSRFSGILLGFAVLGGILASTVRSSLTVANCASATCRPEFAEAIVAGDLPSALAGMSGAARDAAIEHAMRGYSLGFGAALGAAGCFAILSAMLVRRLMRHAD